MNRDSSLASLRSRREPWDLVVIGGGATGMGIALDAASRGYSVALFEKNDFGSGTSSRSTKLIHGGVRYLAQGNISLVREALRERSLLLRNAPTIVRELGFVIPARSIAEAAWYRAGIAAYDLLAGSQRTGASRWLSAIQAAEALPGLRPNDIRAGVLYHDAQFDDARLLIALARTAASCGAALLNYAPVVGFLRNGTGSLRGVAVQDAETRQTLEVEARVVVNATGVFSDGVRAKTGPSTPHLTVSRGSHVVVNRDFLPSRNALLVPKTSDGRVLFAIPWLEHTLIGTTDIPVDEPTDNPSPTSAEIDFILETASGYLASAPKRSDVLSAFAGLRPLVRSSGSGSASLSRDHSIFQEASGLITIVGGKWTTYRKMAEDSVNLAAKQAHLPHRPCRTEGMCLTDSPSSDPVASVIQGVRHEMARTIEDILARRTRLLFVDAAEAIRAAPQTGRILATELGRSPDWVSQQTEQFRTIASSYLVSNS